MNLDKYVLVIVLCFSSSAFSMGRIPHGDYIYNIHTKKPVRTRIDVAGMDPYPFCFKGDDWQAYLSLKRLIDWKIIYNRKHYLEAGSVGDTDGNLAYLDIEAGYGTGRIVDGLSGSHPIYRCQF